MKKGEKPLTLIAGFRCSDGVVLCADSQLTYPGALKFQESKIRRRLAKSRQIRMAFAYAGINDFSEMCMEEIALAIDSTTDDAEIRNSINEKCKEIHVQYYPLYKAPYQLGLELFLAVDIGKTVTLFYIRGPVVARVHYFRCAGTGLYLGHSVAGSLYHENMTIEEASRMAAYVLYQAKTYVDGVGGKSHILRINNKTGWDMVESKEVEYLEAVYSEYLAASRPVLLSYTGWGEHWPVENFKNQLELMAQRLINKRKEMDELYAKMHRENREMIDNVLGQGEESEDDKK